MNLLIRPPRNTAESRCGYAARLAELNGLPFYTVRSYLWPKLLYLKLNSAPTVAKQILFPRYKKWCPACLDASGIFDRGWSIPGVDACTHHKCWLVDTCSTCGRVQTWTSGAYLRCSCGASLKHGVPVHAPSAILRLAGFLQADGSATDGLTEPWAKLGRRDIFQLVQFLGAYGAEVASPRPKKCVGSTRMSVTWPKTAAAAEMLDDWPRKFIAMTHHRLQASANREDGSFTRVLGQYYRELKKQFRAPEMQFLRTAFEAAVREHWKGALGPQNRLIDSCVRDERNLVSLSDATRDLGISANQIVMAAQQIDVPIIHRVSKAGRNFRLVQRDALDRIESQVHDRVAICAAARIAGLPKHSCRSLIPPWLGIQGDLMQDGRHPGVSRKALEAALRPIANLTRIDVLEVDQVTMHAVLKCWKWETYLIVRLLQELSSGRIVPMGSLAGRHGISALILSRDQLHCFRAAQKPVPGSLTIPEVAEVLGIKQEVAYHLIRRSILETKPTKSAAGGRLVGIDEIAKFHRSMIFAREVAHRLRTSPRKAIDTVHRAGIQPVTGPRVDRCRQVIFRRQDVESRFGSLTLVEDLTVRA